MNPELLFLILACIVSPGGIFWHISVHVVRNEVCVDVKDDFSLRVAQFWSLGHGQVERHGHINAERRDVENEGIWALVLQFNVENIEQSSDDTSSEFETIVDDFHSSWFHVLIELLLPELLLHSELDILNREDKRLLHLPNKLIFRGSSQLKLNGDVLQEEFSDLERDWDKARGLGIDGKRDIDFAQSSSHSVSVSHEFHG